MRNQICMGKKRCAEKREEEEELENNNKMKKIIKRCPILHQNKSSSSSWSDLGSDLLGEINKKLCSYADHIRFRGVCRSWRAVNHGDQRRRAADVLPWLMEVHTNFNQKTLCYKFYEPPSPAKSNTSTYTISHTINLYDYFSSDIINSGYGVRLIRYVDGWLHLSVVDKFSFDTCFIFFSIATKASFTLPLFDHTKHPTYLALSATPESPDCVFLVLCLTHYCTRGAIGIFRHGDTHWTITESVEGGFGLPTRDADTVVCIRGVFYFLMSTGIGSYDLATGVLKVDAFSTLLKLYRFDGFFGLDEDVILAYIEEETWKFCIRKYDWSNKDWVPLQSLGGRSVYLSNYSVYVDQINYYGMSSANKIYVQQLGRPLFADEYTLEDGQLSKCPSARRGTGPGSFTQFAIWVCPPEVLLRK